MKALSHYHSKAIANVKGLGYRQMDRQNDGRTDKHTGQKLYAPDLLMQGGGYIYIFFFPIV